MLLLKRPPSPDDILSLINDWENSKKMSTRDKIKAFHALGDTTLKFFASSKLHTTENLALFRQILQEAVQLPGVSPRYVTGLRKITLAWMTQLQGKEPEIVQKKDGVLQCDAAIIAIADPTLFTCPATVSTEIMLQIMHEKNAFFFNTGSDGKFNIQLRVVTGKEPLVTAKKFKLIKGALAQTAIIRSSSGVIGVGAVEQFPETALSLKVEPGCYKVGVFICTCPRTGDFSYYIVLCPTSSSLQLHYQEVELLEPHY